MNDLAMTFKALSDPTRVRILDLLKRADAACCSKDDRVCACDLEAEVKLSQPAVSHHMKCLVQTGLVESEREGRFTYYRINRTAFARLASFLDGFVGSYVPGDADATKTGAHDVH
ncbi:MAG: ArsR family transcriptional regulator [Rhodospirillales bacterium]|nr:ArsR family transcriptional regulator [Rhodospirillales bacterium]